MPKTRSQRGSELRKVSAKTFVPPESSSKIVPIPPRMIVRNFDTRRATFPEEVSVFERNFFDKLREVAGPIEKAAHCTGAEDLTVLRIILVEIERVEDELSVLACQRAFGGIFWSKANTLVEGMLQEYLDGIDDMKSRRFHIFKEIQRVLGYYCAKQLTFSTTTGDWDLSVMVNVLRLAKLSGEFGIPANWIFRLISCSVEKVMEHGKIVKYQWCGMTLNCFEAKEVDEFQLKNCMGTRFTREDFNGLLGILFNYSYQSNKKVPTYFYELFKTNSALHKHCANFLEARERSYSIRERTPTPTPTVVKAEKPIISYEKHLENALEARDVTSSWVRMFGFGPPKL